MENLQYNIHKILWSKYRFIINILIFSLIYLVLYSQQIVYCMVEDSFFISSKKEYLRSELAEITVEQNYYRERQMILLSRKKEIQSNIRILNTLSFSKSLLHPEIREESLAAIASVSELPRPLLIKSKSDTNLLIHNNEIITNLKLQIDSYNKGHMEGSQYVQEHLNYIEAEAKKTIRTLTTRIDAIQDQHSRLFSQLTQVFQTTQIENKTISPPALIENKLAQLESEIEQMRSETKHNRVDPIVPDSIGSLSEKKNK